jgi:hypothetical protein
MTMYHSSIHPSIYPSILHGVLVCAGSLWPLNRSWPTRVHPQEKKSAPAAPTVKICAFYVGRKKCFCLLLFEKRDKIMSFSKKIVVPNNHL